MFNRPLNSFVPSIYEGVVEMDDIINSEEQLMEIARKETFSAFANTFVLTADETGITMFENMLNILSDASTEDLEFRRERVLNRMAMSPPFTFRFLKQRLDEIIGAGAYTAYIDFNNYTMYIESSAVNQNWYYEIEFTINRIKPCNMVFTNVPYTSKSINISEEISYAELKWLYRLGSWKLGKSSFATQQGGGVIKMSQTKSIQQELLNDTASFLLDHISHVLINDTTKISDFTVKRVSENVVSIEYSVTPDITNLITNIKLMRADDAVLTQAAVYVPVSQSVISKHIITVKEGV